MFSSKEHEKCITQLRLSMLNKPYKQIYDQVQIVLASVDLKRKTRCEGY